jgi:hypothetical protein
MKEQSKERELSGAGSWYSCDSMAASMRNLLDKAVEERLRRYRERMRRIAGEETGAV